MTDQMSGYLKSIFAFLLFLLFQGNPTLAGDGWIRINQLGYLPGSVKVAVFISDQFLSVRSFELCNALTGKTVFKGVAQSANGEIWGMQSAYRLDFSQFQEEGGYFLKAGNYRSPNFRIGKDVYKGIADFTLNYMRQQRCGFNPFLKDSCHLHDGFIVGHPIRNGEIIDVTGGWHDASDYLQYTTTSANAVYQLFFAYEKNPQVFGDACQANGLSESNGVPDVLDEAIWGLQWLLKMNPADGEMYNQIADDRDHVGLRLPTHDKAKYGKEDYRPVYFVSGEPQQRAKSVNRTTGVSSTAGKFASAFAIGARVLKTRDPQLSALLTKKAEEAYRFGLSKPGNCQTACVVSPYSYEEDNWVDDMELAAAELNRLTGNENLLDEGNYWGGLEPVTPWMIFNNARHYQYYPFMNLGHYRLASNQGNKNKNQFIQYMKDGLLAIQDRAKEDPFRIGIPFVWCSNNFIAAALTQARLYNEVSGDDGFLETEAAMRDWLLGCNPWGTSMVCGLPAGGDYPDDPHSSLTYILGGTTTGGLVDGPVYTRIFQSQLGISLRNKDAYAAFQNGRAVYHDDLGDYSTNEPTMDGTASLAYYFSTLEKEVQPSPDAIDPNGAIIRRNPKVKTIYLVFTADTFGEGRDTILNTLEKEQVKGSFFLTGNFLRNPGNRLFIRNVVKKGHYLGPHSDKHLLYADWIKRDSLLVTREVFEKDLANNYKELKKHGILPENAGWFMPPYEWHNKAIANWSAALGLKLVNLTPGTATNADYTTPGMTNYKSSDTLLKKFFDFEATNADGLNGSIVLIHLGTDQARTDKFYSRLGGIIKHLKDKGYTFEKFGNNP